MAKKWIYVAVTLPGDYQCRTRPTYPKLGLHGWTENEKDALTRHLDESVLGPVYRNRFGWVEECEVNDAGSSVELPDELFVIVRVSKEWDGEIGGTSWFANPAFISEEKAKEYAKRDTELYWYWAVRSRRFRAAT
ncbi:MAG: hypothetical protein G01um101429_686 [Parcubacteria group bacterium Gr01-1014_29]|nr:MAG: hypothetical protein G01um101429_686 [Parcubacteria group bacterium Gr01-1014_29]